MRVMVIAAHPDDETLGCGGTLLSHLKAGDETHWLIVTRICENLGYSAARVSKRQEEIKRVAAEYRFTTIHELGFYTAMLDTVPIVDLIAKISRVFSEVSPEIVYTVFEGDPHTDHRIVSSAVASSTKWFRIPSIRRILAYETLSETGIVQNFQGKTFGPTSYYDIGEFLDRKIEIMNIYKSEIGDFPFPRSDKAIRDIAAMRGAQAGFEAAEAFILLRERIYG